MAVSITHTSVTHLPGGEVLSRGTVTFDNVYVTGGETFDISSIFSGSPTVIVTGDDGYVIEHDRGNAAAGVLIAKFANGGAAAGAALIQVTNATDLSSVVCPFVAVGPGVQS